MDRRNTIQRQLVLNAVRTLCRHATADEVYELVSAAHPSISKATVYRNLNLLAESGEIRRVSIPGSPDRYDHTVTAHYHVQCIRCGSVSDVDMPYQPDLNDKIRDPHGYRFVDHAVLFRGICPACQQQESNTEE